MTIINLEPKEGKSVSPEVADCCRAIVVMFDNIKSEQPDFAREILYFKPTFENALSLLLGRQDQRRAGYKAFNEALTNLIGTAQGWLNKQPYTTSAKPFSRDDGFAQIQSGQSIVAGNRARQEQTLGANTASPAPAMGIGAAKSNPSAATQTKEQQLSELAKGLKKENEDLKRLLAAASSSSSISQVYAQAQNRIRELEAKITELDASRERVTTAKNEYYIEVGRLQKEVEKRNRALTERSAVIDLLTTENETLHAENNQLKAQIIDFTQAVVTQIEAAKPKQTSALPPSARSQQELTLEAELIRFAAS